MQWLFLIGAIVFEVFGTISLRMAATGQRAYYGAVAVGYLFAFGFLTLTLNEGLGLGVAYGIWAASGVALTAVASKILFKEPLTPIMLGGIALTSAACSWSNWAPPTRTALPDYRPRRFRQRPDLPHSARRAWSGEL